MVWPEVEQALKNRRYELVLSGEKLHSHLAAKNELDPSIWSLQQLNFLEISNCPLVESLPSDIGALIHLSTLTLTKTHLRRLPREFSSLTLIRHLNISFNQLEELSDEFFVHLPQLETLNASNNELKHLPNFVGETNRKLAIVNVSHNELTTLPQWPEELDNLAQVDLSANLFEVFPDVIFNLHSLKNLLFESNLLTEIPTQLAQLTKLKDLRLKSNPLKDNRLKKLIEQEKIKAVIEYLARLDNEQKKDKHQTGTHKTPTTKNNNDEPSTEEERIHILHFDQQQADRQGKQITLLPAVVGVRGHLLCCIVRDLDFSSSGNLKRFLTLQNALHDGICQKRTLATIATHDLKSIKGNLVYDARDPTQIGFIPLGKGPKLVSAKDFYDQLYQEAEHERKLKKRNQLSGLNKYLTLLENETFYPCLADEDRYVISLPPLTNSDRTKLSGASDSILIEISSSSSLDVCRRVMSQLLKEMLRLQITRDEHLLVLQQTRVVDEKGLLRTTFPSRTDLNDWTEINEGKILVQRLFPEK